ncbi:hypothetical protein [Pseudoruegeria sp. HB172150]|uniref:hypothetical protein n=1 Tax=Pseudoruegeria sp. HB172150 TaxID=2721164 RepID=UPI001554BF9A|nr:hypothetical protein [Pseudoruegeria sp. HB172150]
MLRILTVTALTASLAAVPVATFAMPDVEAVKVEVDLDEIGNAEAGAHWTNIAEDLENAIVAKLVGNFVSEDEEALRISVDIDEVVLASTLESLTGIADSQLAGRVKISHESNNSAYEAYDLTVNYDNAQQYFVVGTDVAVITVADRDFYDALIEAFADRVVANLED